MNKPIQARLFTCRDNDGRVLSVITLTEDGRVFIHGDTPPLGASFTEDGQDAERCDQCGAWQAAKRYMSARTSAGNITL